MSKETSNEKEKSLGEVSRMIDEHLARIDFKLNVIIALLTIIALLVLGVSVVFVLLVIGSFV